MNESSQRTKISRILSCLEHKFRSDSDNVFLIYRSKTAIKIRPLKRHSRSRTESVSNRQLKINKSWNTSTVWKVSKNGVISGPYFPVFGLNTGKYGPEITPYLDTFHAVKRFE